MICPFCTHKTYIYNSRRTDNGIVTWRRHKCRSCKTVFTTRERIDWGSLVAIRNSHGRVTPYSREKILDSILSAFHYKKPSDGVISSLGDAIEAECATQTLFANSLVDSSQLQSVVATVLGRFDTQAALTYLSQQYNGEVPDAEVRAIFQINQSI